MENLIREFESSLRSAEDLAAQIPDSKWKDKTDNFQWSPAECIVHLNSTSETFILILRKELSNARSKRIFRKRRFHFDLIGWFLARYMEPPYKQKTKTSPPFEPDRVDSKPTVIEVFRNGQTELINIIRNESDLDWNFIRIQSPFDRRLKYNVYSAFRILAAHQRRHLWQARNSIIK